MHSRRNYHGLSDSGLFYRDRDEWMRYVTAHQELGTTVRLVACYIALRVNPLDRKAWPKQATIAKDIGVSPKTVKRAIKELVKAGLLFSDPPKRRGTARSANRYSLIHPADKGTPVTPRGGDTSDPYE